MDVSSALGSLQSAVSLAMLRKTMNQDAGTVASLLDGMVSASPTSPAPTRLLDTRA